MAAGCSERQLTDFNGLGPRIRLFKSLILSSLQSSLKPVAGREQALGLQSDVVPDNGDVAGFGKAQNVLPHTLPDTPLLAHQHCSSFVSLFSSL